MVFTYSWLNLNSECWRTVNPEKHPPEHGKQTQSTMYVGHPHPCSLVYALTSAMPSNESLNFHTRYNFNTNLGL